jgi:hypothetical protein
MTNFHFYLKFAFNDITRSLLCILYLKCNAGHVGKETQFFIPLFQNRYSFLQTKIRPNSKSPISSTGVTFSNFEFTEGRKCKHSVRIHMHYFILLSIFEVRKFNLLKI